MRYAKIRKRDISNGPGTRVTLFTQGCYHHCKNCFNQETWDFCGGKEWSKEKENRVIELCGKDGIRGLSILGGDPLDIYVHNKELLVHEDNDDLLRLVKRFKETYPDKTIWLWTGYVWESVFPPIDETCNIPLSFCSERLFQYIDVVVDGPFIEELKDPRLDYAGSTNQRVINVERSLKAKKVILWNNIK